MFDALVNSSFFDANIGALINAGVSPAEAIFAVLAATAALLFAANLLRRAFRRPSTQAATFNLKPGGGVWDDKPLSPPRSATVQVPHKSLCAA